MTWKARIATLSDAVRSGDSEAVEAFWDEVGETGTPLVEETAEGQTLVTVVLRAKSQPENVALVGWVFALLDQVPDSDVWYLTLEVPSDLRASYGFAENAGPVFNWPDYFRAQPDPLNKQTMDSPADEMGLPELHRSLLELPGSPPQPWVEERAGVAHGAVSRHRMRSNSLDNERTLWIYEPSEEPQGCLVLFDGAFYVETVPMPTILNNMAADRVLPPLLGVMVSSSSLMTRNEESNCNDAFSDFLADELMPWVGERYPMPLLPDRVIVGGKSAGGLAATYAAFRRPDVFGNVLSQSATLHWKRNGQTLIDRVESSDSVTMRAYVEAGAYEYWGPDQDFAALGKRVSELIAAKGGQTHFVKFTGGHDPLVWRGTISDGLLFLTEAWH